MVKINVISGFLGAGKTTLIRKLLTGSLRNEKVVLLENEYGEIGIDGGFMKDVGITVTELNAGCICCTLAGDFQAAVDQLIDTYHPDRILVEPTGVGKLSEILSAVEKAKERHPDIEIGGSATVVDAGKCRMYMKNFGEFFLDQVKSASTVIFSRTQLLDADRVEKSRLLIAEAHPDARIITTPWDDMTPDFMLEVIENGKPIYFAPLEDDDDDEDDDEHEHHHHHHHDDDDEDEHEHHHHHHHDHDADDVFDSWGVETAKKFSEDDLREILSQLVDEDRYGAVLRAKGIVAPADGGEWIHFDYVPGELSVRRGTAEVTGRLCVIGAGTQTKALRKLFIGQ